MVASPPQGDKLINAQKESPRFGSRISCGATSLCHTLEYKEAQNWDRRRVGPKEAGNEMSLIFYAVAGASATGTDSARVPSLFWVMEIRRLDEIGAPSG